jgi:hypothetical protein
MLCVIASNLTPEELLGEHFLCFIRTRETNPPPFYVLLPLRSLQKGERTALPLHTRSNRPFGVLLANDRDGDRSLIRFSKIYLCNLKWPPASFHPNSANIRLESWVKEKDPAPRDFHIHAIKSFFGSVPFPHVPEGDKVAGSFHTIVGKDPKLPVSEFNFWGLKHFSSHPVAEAGLMVVSGACTTRTTQS